jgi:hypothetical protein
LDLVDSLCYYVVIVVVGSQSFKTVGFDSELLGNSVG